MRAGVVAFGLLLAGGIVAALLMERASAPVLSSPALRRRNYRDHELATAGGIVIVLAVLVVEGARTALAEFGLGDELSDSLLRSMVLFACFAFAFLGLIDDLLGTDTDRGFRGHLQALAHGRLTTGAMKLFGGAVVAIVLTAAPGEVSGRRLLADAALVALAANLGNLLDRAPGRTIKVGIIAYLPIALAAGTVTRRAWRWPRWWARQPVCFPPTLANGSCSATPGPTCSGPCWAWPSCSRPADRFAPVVLIVLVVLNLASERVSFTAVIDRTPGLRQLDRLGRRPAPRARARRPRNPHPAACGRAFRNRTQDHRLRRCSGRIRRDGSRT